MKKRMTGKVLTVPDRMAIKAEFKITEQENISVKYIKEQLDDGNIFLSSFVRHPFDR